MPRRAILVGAVLLIPIDSFLAQDATRTSRITGVVVDSVRGVGLQGAEVMVSGLSSIVMTDKPVFGATVSLTWVDISAGGRTQIVSTPHELQTPTDSAGFFKFCGRPSGVSNVTRYDGTFSLGEVPIGTQLIVVSHAGFAPVGVSVNVTSREPTDIIVTLGPNIIR